LGWYLLLKKSGLHKLSGNDKVKGNFYNFSGQIMNNLFHRLSQLRFRTVVATILIVTSLIAVGLFYLWLGAGKKIEGIVTEQFNEQQLMLARKIADNVEVYIDFLEYQLVSYTQAYQVEAMTPEHFRAFLALQINYLNNFGILEIREYDAKGNLDYVYSPGKTSVPVKPAPLAERYLTWAKEGKNQDALLMTEVFPRPDEPRQGSRVMAILAPLYGSVDKSQKTEKLRFDGVLEVIFDPYYISGLVTKEVRSGKTGYPWIVDKDGIFLAHYEKPFVGKHHIQVRRERNPDIPFAKIDELVQNHILKGEEGTDWYISGWHREKLGQVKKLIAYTPIRFNTGMVRGILQVENPDQNFWGVGVVAPIEEVSGLVRGFQVDQGLLVGFFLLLLMGVGYLLIGAAYSWNRVLSHEVEEKAEELQQSHELLLRSERFAAVGEAAAYVSHEIKNPLMVIGGFARQLERNPEVPPTAGAKLRIISDEVRRLENFLGELRDFTRPAAPAKQEADLNELVQEVAIMMQETAKEMNIQLVTRLASNLPLVSYDPNQMKQVLINLVKNALEAMDTGGVITMTTTALDGQVRLSVHDTGKGIDPGIIPDIFNPFFTTKKTGTGLGLAVINKIIEDHHGTITVESSKGQGSTFTVHLPCRP
jgi:two-component system sensor histidine kinase HydH